jgi:hypothetical protein
MHRYARSPLVRLSAVFCTLTAFPVLAQTTRSTLPAIPPTASAPIAAIATPGDVPGARHHRPEVTCSDGQLTVRADNSSLNGILRAVSRCTGMQITGGVQDQRVFGNYGPAAPGTVLATLLDGTGTNMLLLETSAEQPARLILSPRTAGPTPPGPNQVPDDDVDASTAAPPLPAGTNGRGYAPNSPAYYGMAGSGASSRSRSTAQSEPGNNPTGNNPGGQSGYGLTNTNTPNSAVTSPPVMPPSINNVMGSPSNTSRSAADYPTTNSVSIDTLPVPYTTPKPDGIVDAPNPPPAGSDTARMLNGQTTNMPGNIDITDQPTNGTAQPGATNTATPADSPATGAAAGSALTPQQIYQQLQQMQQQKQQNQSPAPTTTPQ